MISREEREQRGVFGTTRWSVVLKVTHGGSDERGAALEWLCQTYWPAVFVYVRRTVAHQENARDLTQAFFAKLLEKQWLVSVDREKGRFRTFLLTAVKRFLADELDRATAQKRGGGALLLSLEGMAAEESRAWEPAAGRSPDEEFDRRWALAVLNVAMCSLRSEAMESGHGELFAACQGFLTPGEEPETLTGIAQRFGLGESAAKMRLHRWRGRYRELIREEVAQTIPRLADLDEEMRHLLRALAF